MKLTTALTVAALLAPVGLASAAPTNQGFEAGLTGWSTIGSVEATATASVTTSVGSITYTINPFQTMMAHLDSNPIAVAGVEAAIGLALGSLQPGNANPDGGSLTDASAIWQDFV